MKIIASDYDGTLSFQGKISDEDKNAIELFRKNGGKFGIVTGRDLEQALWVVRDLKNRNLEIDYVACCTGAVILNSDGKIISMRKQKMASFFEDIIKYAKTLKLGSFCVSNELVRCYVDANSNIEHNLGAISEFTQANAWFYSEEDAEKFVQYLREFQSDNLIGFRNGGSVDMPPVGVSKPIGILEYAKLFDEEAEIYTVGDNINDIPMLEAYESFAVSNARDEVKKIAKHQCNRIADMIECIMEAK